MRGTQGKGNDKQKSFFKKSYKGYRNFTSMTGYTQLWKGGWIIRCLTKFEIKVKMVSFTFVTTNFDKQRKFWNKL